MVAAFKCLLSLGNLGHLADERDGIHFFSDEAWIMVEKTQLLTTFSRFHLFVYRISQSYRAIFYAIFN